MGTASKTTPCSPCSLASSPASTASSRSTRMPAPRALMARCATMPPYLVTHYNPVGPDMQTVQELGVSGRAFYGVQIFPRNLSCEVNAALLLNTLAQYTEVAGE